MGIYFYRVIELTNEIKEISEMGVNVGIVVGGGNFCRGRANMYMDRCTADHIGMLATTMNSLTLQDALRQINCDSRVQTGIKMR